MGGEVVETTAKVEEQHSPEAVAVIDEAKKAEWALEAAVSGIECIQEQVNSFRSSKEKDKKEYASSIASWRKEFTASIKVAVEQGDRMSVFGQIGTWIDLAMKKFVNTDNPYSADSLLNYTMTTIDDTGVSVDYDTMDTASLQTLIQDFETTIAAEKTGYKKLHYIWMMSRAKDALAKQEQHAFKTQYEKIQAELQPWDIIAFWNNADTFNAMLTAKADNPLAHIWIIDASTPPHLCHSTMDGDVFNPTGWKTELFSSYLDKTKPRALVILRAVWTAWWVIGEKAHEMVAQWFKYDRTAAVIDLWVGGKWMEEGYNCGEFVWEVLRSSMGIVIDEKKDALPGSYLAMPQLQPIYMDNYVW